MSLPIPKNRGAKIYATRVIRTEDGECDWRLDFEHEDLLRGMNRKAAGGCPTYMVSNCLEDTGVTGPRKGFRWRVLRAEYAD